MKNLTALETLQVELDKIMDAQTQCVDDYGFVRQSCRYRYQLLVRKASELRSSINWFKTLAACLLLTLCVAMQTAYASDLDQAEAQLKQSLAGEATVTRQDLPKFTDEQIEAIEKARSQLAEVE